MSTQPVPQPDNFQYIKLPDGSYGKFASDASDDVIKSAISKDFPQAYAPTSQQPGFLGNMVTHALGVPEGVATNPGNYLNPFSKGYWQQAAQEKAQSKANPMQSVGYDPNAGISQFIPGSDIVKDAQAGNYGGATGDLAALLGKLAMLKGMRGTKVSTPEIAPPSRPALPAGPIELGPSSNAASPSAAPAYSNTTRAQRMGLLLNSGEQPAIPLGPSSVTPQTQEGVLPAARKVLNNGNVQYLTRPLNPGEAPAVAKNVNTQSQSALIDAIQSMMNRQTETESPFQTANRRMQETAVTPFDRATPKPTATASGPIESPTIENASNLNSPGQVRGFQEQAALKLFGKSYDSLSVPEKLQTLPEATRIQNQARSAVETPRVPTSDADMQDLLMKSIQRVQAKARSAKAGD